MSSLWPEGPGHPAQTNTLERWTEKWVRKEKLIPWKTPIQEVNH